MTSTITVYDYMLDTQFDEKLTIRPSLPLIMIKSVDRNRLRFLYTLQTLSRHVCRSACKCVIPNQQATATVLALKS